MGRWVSEDPIGFAAGDENLARYVSNNAPLYVDPSGLDFQLLQVFKATQREGDSPDRTNADQVDPNGGEDDPEGTKTPGARPIWRRTGRQIWAMSAHKFIVVNVEIDGKPAKVELHFDLDGFSVDARKAHWSEMFLKEIPSTPAQDQVLYEYWKKQEARDPLPEYYDYGPGCHCWTITEELELYPNVAQPPSPPRPLPGVTTYW